VPGRLRDAPADIPGLTRRLRAHRGIVLGPAELTRRNPLRVSDVLYGHLGVTVRQSTFGLVPTFRGSAGGACLPTIALDGRFVPWGADSSIDDWVGAAELRAVEIYPRWVDAPLEFQRSTRGNHQCGVLLLWTGVRDAP
jgi:hypothetical protein